MVVRRPASPWPSTRGTGTAPGSNHGPPGSVCTGVIKPTGCGTLKRTGTDKRPVAGAVRLHRPGADGDQIADLLHHGGADHHLTVGFAFRAWTTRPDLLPALAAEPQSRDQMPAIHASTSSGWRGRCADRISQPSSVITMSSSIRTPMPRSSSGTIRSALLK